MKTISIRELHEATGRWVREAVRLERLVITERGRPVATLVPYLEPESTNPFKTRKLRPGFARLRGRLGGGPDSTSIVSAGRDRT